MSEIVKLKGSPIQRRMERLQEFKRFVASNRKVKSIQELVALYALESGLRKKVVEEYLQLLLDSGINRKHHVGRGRKMLLTEAEFQSVCRRFERRWRVGCKLRSWDTLLGMSVTRS